MDVYIELASTLYPSENNIKGQTAKPQISDVAANPIICLALKGPASILFTVCFGRGFQYHFLDFVAVQES